MNVVIRFPEKVSWDEVTELLDKMAEYKNGHPDPAVGFEMTFERGITPCIDREASDRPLQGIWQYLCCRFSLADRLRPRRR